MLRRATVRRISSVVGSAADLREPPRDDPGSILTSRSPTQWYRSSIFYEVLVRGFYDATNDGNGDLRGLTEKLDYLEWLGHRLPLAAAVLRLAAPDGGYDISDFLTVHPDFGTIEDAGER